MYTPDERCTAVRHSGPQTFTQSNGENAPPLPAQVWTPFAKSVSLRIGDSRFALRSQRDGCWHEEEPHLLPGCLYWFELDGAKRPDPRSPSQPKGLHGPSQHIRADSFRWPD